jgi:GAF domain-containing protein
MNEELESLTKRFDRLNQLYQVGKVIHSTLEQQAALQHIVDEAVRLMHASSGSTVLINPTTGLLEIHASSGLPAAATELKLRVGEGVTGWVALNGRPARVGNVVQDSRYVLLRPEVRSELAVPLEVQGEVCGVLNVDSDRVDAFSVEDQELLEALAGEAAKVIHQTSLYEQLRLKVRLFESLASVSQAINSTLNLDDALSVITREACSLMRAKMCSLMLLDDSRAWLDLRASFGAGETYLRKPRVSVEESSLGMVVRRQKPVQIENVQTSSRYQSLDVARHEGLVALLSVPLIFVGQVIGTLSVYTGRPYRFSNEEIRILSALAELSAIAIERARLYERVVERRGPVAPEREALRAWAAGGGGGARDPQSAHGDEDAVPFAGLAFPGRRPAGQGRPHHRRKNRASEPDRRTDPRLRAHHGTAVCAGAAQ